MILLVAAALLLAFIHFASIALAAWRIAPNGTEPQPVASPPPVSIVIPCCGVETFTPETLDRAFRLDWPVYELIFCVADGQDRVLAFVERARAAHPSVPCRVLIGDDRISANPKLNNCVKGWYAARHDWVVLADSNILMPPTYLQQLLGAWRDDTGLVCSTPLGARPEGFWAEVECAFLNTQQARWQYAGEAIGYGFAQGKSMLWQKPMLNAHGGIEALAEEIAEDAASTKLVRRMGRHVHLVAAPFEQPLGRRTARDVWMRQCRWARLRRVTFPLFFAPEILLGAVPALILAVVAAMVSDIGLKTLFLGVLAAAYLPEIALALSKNWRVSLRLLPAMLMRDILMTAIWLRSWIAGSFDWRGNAMTIGRHMSELEDASTA